MTHSNLNHQKLLDAAKFSPQYLNVISAWVGHLPFAAWIIKDFQPKNFVELGSHYGASYFSFCQSVHENKLATKCYAVDTWQGDEHTNEYGEDVYVQVNKHNKANYARFSSLLRMRFDDALNQFEAGSVELLHIDGFHTYEAVHHDFTTWLPKLAPGAIVLFHDIVVRERGFGVWRLWEELQAQYPNNIAFQHCFGLGVIQLPGGAEDKKSWWCDYDESEKQQFMAYFQALGDKQQERRQLTHYQQHMQQLEQQLQQKQQPLQKAPIQISHPYPQKQHDDAQIAVFIHLADLDVWPELTGFLAVIPQVFDLYISSSDTRNNHEAILAAYPTAVIEHVVKQGQDILPFVNFIKKTHALNYRSVLRLHFNDFIIENTTEAERYDTISCLLQSRKRVADILSLFNNDGKLGLFTVLGGLESFNHEAAQYFSDVSQMLASLGQRIEQETRYLFAKHSVFWFRPQALGELLRFNVTEAQFKAEEALKGGAMTAVMDRFLGTLSQVLGYKSLDALPKYDDMQYQHFLENFRAAELARENILADDFQPLIHCLMYVEQHTVPLLADTLDSLAAQSYRHWQLTVLSNTASPDAIFTELPQLQWIQIEQVEVLQTVLSNIEQTGDWLSFLEAGDYLEPSAFQTSMEYAQQYPEWHFFYSDEDKIGAEGFFHSPHFKPDFNLDLFYSLDYMGGLTLFKIDALLKINPIAFPQCFNAYAVECAYLAQFNEQSIGHLSKILMHRPENRYIANLSQVDERKVLLEQYFILKNETVNIVDGHFVGALNVQHLFGTCPKVSIIIPTKDRIDLLKPCISSIFAETVYTNYEIIIVDNQSSEPETMQYFQELEKSHGHHVTVISYPHEFNYSAINNLAAEQATGDYLLLLNNDTGVLQAEWLSTLLNYVQREEVGIVGVRLVTRQNTIQHGGIFIGINGGADFAHTGLTLSEMGYAYRARVAQNFSAVSASCLMIAKSLYQHVGGFNQEHLKLLFNDVDLCLKVKEQGYKVVWTPYVTVFHQGASSIKVLDNTDYFFEQVAKENNYIHQQWLTQLANDPAYNSNLSLKSANFEQNTDMQVSWDVCIDKQKPKIYAFPNNSSGVGEYRVRAPLRVLTESGKVLSSLSKNMGELVFPNAVEVERIQPDVMLLQNGFLALMQKPWAEYKKVKNIFRIAGIDDVVHLLPHTHPKHGVWGNARKLIKQHLALTDRLIVANPVLAEEYSKFIDDIVVVPNYLEYARWGKLILPEKSQAKKLRVGWAGGNEHQGDLAFIEPVIKALYKEVDWIFMGSCPESMRPYVAEFHGGVDFQYYPQHLANLNLELAIAPLEHNRFNEAKTNLRLLEFGIMGWPIVCSDITPYKNAPVTRVGNNVDYWVRDIREKIQDVGALRAEGAVLRQWVLDHYILENHTDEWFDALMPA